MNWITLKAAGLTFGDTFVCHGATRKDFTPVGTKVRIEHSTISKNGVRLINAATGEHYDNCSGLGTAKWWIA
jgi:hypothetical protein